jgi:hypothetical protein
MYITNSCQLCGRPLMGIIESHHLVPKTFKGTDTVPIHKMCHQKIHATFTERELQHYYHTITRLIEHSEIQKFIKWVKSKPPEFYSKNNQTTDRKRKRKR